MFAAGLSSPALMAGRPFGLVSAVAGLLAGTGVQLHQAALWPLAWYGLVAAGAVLVALALRWRVRQGRSPAGMALMVAALAASVGFALAGSRAVAVMAQGLQPALEGRDLRVRGVIASVPQFHDAGARFRFQVEEARADGVVVAVPSQVLLGWWGGVAVDEDGLRLQRQPGPLRAGDRWALTVRLKAPHGHRNPYGFDYEQWLWDQGLRATGTVRAGPSDAAQWLGDSGQYPLQRLRQDVRDAITARLASAPVGMAAQEHGVGPERIAGVVAALVTGDQASIARADWDVFRATGVAHLMSISGLHITLFAWLAALVVGAAWRASARAGWRLCLWFPAPDAARCGGLVCAAAYAVFSGWGVPAQRTTLMLATVVVLRLGGRHWPWPLVWMMVAAVVTLADPWALLAPGFWLSFVAVGLLFATDNRAKNDRFALGIGSFHSKTVLLVREQVILTVALAPLTLLLFGQVSLAGLVANLVAVPWVTLVVTPLALGGLLWGGLWDGASAALHPLAAMLQVMAQWPLAVLWLPQAPLWAGIGALAGAALLVLPVPWRLRALGLPLVLPVLLWSPPRPAPGSFDLLAADIGQGNAVLVRTAQRSLVYDAGPRYSAESDAGHRVLVPLLRALGERIDRLVLSHGDADHIGGAAPVLAQQNEADLLSSLPADHALNRLRAGQRCVAGQRWEWDGVRFQILHPRDEDYERVRRTNALSCVLRIEAQGRVALLAGDIEAAQEQRLAESAGALRADVLLVPHHGSKTSSTSAFVQAVSPRWALVQAGYRNRFGHPAADVVARYRAVGSTVSLSSECGAAHWSSALPDQLRCHRDQVRRYWHHR